MAAYIETFYAAIETKVGATWADCLPASSGGGIIRSEVLERIPLDVMTLPFAAIHLPEFIEEDWGIANASFRCYVEIYRVQSGPENITALLTKLEAMRDAFLLNTLSYGQVTSPGMSISFSSYVTPVATVLSKALQAAVGMIRIPCLVGESY